MKSPIISRKNSHNFSEINPDRIEIFLAVSRKDLAEKWITIFNWMLDIYKEIHI